MMLYLKTLVLVSSFIAITTVFTQHKGQYIRSLKDTDTASYTRLNKYNLITPANAANQVWISRLYIIDSKMVTQSEFEEKYHAKINTYNVVKILTDKEGVKLYGEQGKYGVVVLTSKK